MMADCPHAIDPAERCPASCRFAACMRPNHEITSDPLLLFEPEIDRTAAMKEQCIYCGFFLRNGPRIS